MKLNVENGNSYIVGQFLEIITGVSKKGNSYRLISVGDSKNFTKINLPLSDDTYLERQFTRFENVVLEVSVTQVGYNLNTKVHKVLLNFPESK